MKFFVTAILVCLYAHSILEAAKGDEFTEDIFVEETIEPWFTGPLLTPSGSVVPVGYINIEPYLFETFTYGYYDSHWNKKKTQTLNNLNSSNLIEVGVTEWMDILFTVNGFWNERAHITSIRFGDLPVGVDIQLLSQQEKSWWPAIKLGIRETLPLGKYDQLNPQKLGTDISGEGTYATGVGLVCSRMIWFRGVHFLSLRFSAGYQVFTDVHVRGLNAYGGGYGTCGKIALGNQLLFSTAFEYSFTRNIALACDIVYQHTAKNSFKGKNGFLPSGLPATNKAPSSEVFSIAPALEYNWSEAWGVIAGCWFTIAGRNSNAFASGVIALNYYGALGKKKS